MASLRLTFPEKEEPTVIALTGARLTIGRLPFNTIQIIDRTVSGFHAELVSEHGHYRLHDRGSSNGTLVNGQKISDYHLNEACTITFGTVEAQFSPEAIGAVEEVESFPTRSEINAVRKDNAELKATVEALREESAALRLARPLDPAGAALAVTKEEFDSVVVERESLKERQIKLEEEINRLKTDLAVLKRDRVNLQLAYDGVQREITDLRAKAGGVEAIALQPKAAAAVLAAQASKPTEEIRVEVPAARISPPTAPAPEPPRAQPAPVKAPSAPSSPMRPFAPLPKTPPASPAPTVETKVLQPVASSPIPAVPAGPKPPTVAPSPTPSPVPAASPSRPFSPLPKAPAVAATAEGRPVTATAVTPAAVATPVKAPAGLGSGVRPLAKPPIVASAPEASALPTASTARLAPRPLPSVKLPTQPTVKLAAAPAAPVGPKGTQKLS